jgi:hypothetical protein
MSIPVLVTGTYKDDDNDGAAAGRPYANLRKRRSRLRVDDDLPSSRHEALFGRAQIIQ